MHTFKFQYLNIVGPFRNNVIKQIDTEHVTDRIILYSLSNPISHQAQPGTAPNSSPTAQSIIATDQCLQGALIGGTCCQGLWLRTCWIKGSNVRSMDFILMPARRSIAISVERHLSVSPLHSSGRLQNDPRWQHFSHSACLTQSLMARETTRRDSPI